MPAKKKSTPSQEMDVFCRSAADEINSTFNLWKSHYPDTIKHNTKTNVDWWNIAAAVCQDTATPPALLVYTTFGYMNIRPEDAEMHFGATLFRSDSLLRRGLNNFQDVLKKDLQHLEPLHIIAKGTELEIPRSVIGRARLTAKYSLEYFDLQTKGNESRVTGSSKVPLSDFIFDSMAYHMCNQNPFLLLSVARSPWMKKLAGVNAFLTAARQPWHFDIWEGLTGAGHSLSNLDSLCGEDPRSIYVDGVLGRAWPMMLRPSKLIQPTEDSHRSLLRPALHLQIPTRCSRTDLYLEHRLDLFRRGK